MPIKIECPNTNRTDHMYDDDIELCTLCHGKDEITAYTQAELDKAVSDEREACAEICDTLAMTVPMVASIDYRRGYVAGANRCGMKIRKRGEK